MCQSNHLRSVDQKQLRNPDNGHMWRIYLFGIRF